MKELTPWISLLTNRVLPARVRRWSAARLLSRVAALEAQLMALSDEELRSKSLELRYRIKSGESERSVLPAGFALVRVAAQRTLGMRHYDVQLLGGAALVHGCIAEMQTGEGKTLVATLPVYLRALYGRGVHVATTNDYLASRDAETLRPLYEALGLSVGVVETPMFSDERRAAYACDITYGTASQFGFDFLRDRLLKQSPDSFQETSLPGWNDNGDFDGLEKPVQRGHFFALVDEADSVLIDDARTPLVLGMGSEPAGKIEQNKAFCFSWAARCAERFIEDRHYRYNERDKTPELTYGGRRLVRELADPVQLNAIGYVDLYEFMERAIKVDREYIRDQHYIIRDDEVVIIDEGTGRIAEGRKWGQGIHQAVEAKEEMEVVAGDVKGGHAARVTVQDFFRRYKHLAGMTGTAWTSSYEFCRIYKLAVTRIATNRPVQRKVLNTCVFAHADAKWRAIVKEVREMHEQGRPVLVGTRTIDASDLLSRLLSESGIEHQVLNAYRIAEEAEIVAQAGQRGRVTVATNMAGRGTDIKLGEGVAELGGLHVISTELHESARIDRQLAGRCSRQGDPGSVRCYVSFEDEILVQAFGAGGARRLKYLCAENKDNPTWLVAAFRRAQRVIEGRNYSERCALLYKEKETKKRHVEMGQDPYLESPQYPSQHPRQRRLNGIY